MPFKVKIRSSDMGESKKQKAKKAKKARRRLYPLRFLPLNSVVAL
jgi:hypothetical protein